MSTTSPATSAKAPPKSSSGARGLAYVCSTYSYRAAPAYLVIIVLHIVLRPTSWVHEWFWGTYQFGFVTVLLGPIAAGVAAIDGSRVARGRWQILTSTRPTTALIRWWLASLAPVLACYLLGLAAVLAAVRLSGTPGVPSGWTLVSVLAPLSLLGVEVAIGLSVGFWTASWIAAPVTAVGVFILTLWLYINGPDQFIIVGGATGSLIGLKIRWVVTAGQVAFYLTASVVLLVVACQKGIPNRVDSYKLAGAVVPVLCGLVFLSAVGGNRFVETGGSGDTCVGTGPSVCVAPGYAKYAASVQAELRPYIAALSEAGVTTPQKFVQGAIPGLRNEGPLGIDVLTSAKSPKRIEQYVVLAYVNKACGLAPDYVTMYSGLAYWLAKQVKPRVNYARQDIPEVLQHGSPSAQYAWVRQAVDFLGTCRA